MSVISGELLAGRLMMLLGALLDVADKSNEYYTKAQIKDIVRKLEEELNLKYHQL